MKYKYNWILSFYILIICTHTPEDSNVSTMNCLLDWFVCLKSYIMVLPKAVQTNGVKVLASQILASTVKLDIWQVEVKNSCYLFAFSFIWFLF